MDHRIGMKALEDIRQHGGVGNVSVAEMMARMVQMRTQRCGISGISKLVEIDHPATALLKQLNDQIGADEPGSSGDKDVLPGFVHGNLTYCASRAPRKQTLVVGSVRRIDSVNMLDTLAALLQQRDKKRCFSDSLIGKQSKLL
jgi:hypothetical protein